MDNLGATAVNNQIINDSIITSVANHFFNDLAYGNRIPALDYNGVKFKFNVNEVPLMVQKYVELESINELVKYYLKKYKEVSIILDTLKYYQSNNTTQFNKIKILQKAANDFRWLNAIKKSNKFILVNIPSAQLKAYDSNKLIMAMRVIVGKSTTPTNTLSSTINRLILNPYWMVPKSIIKNEMFDKYKVDKDYFFKNGFTLINEKYKTVDPCNIDISKYSKDYFPFIVRQGTGLDNSLGLLKIEFDSPSSIYLHDTPQKELFKNAKRFYSHGCIRMERPIEIGNWLLQNNRIAIDTFDFKQPSKYTTPRPILVTISTQVIVWYSLIDFDNKGALKFYQNVYNK
jgi:murein L,D-transpeptidase YcbB/YkuD